MKNTAKKSDYRRTEARGLTAVELAIALTVIALILIATLYFVRQRRMEQHQRLQDAADLSPTEIFDVSLRPERTTMSENEPLAFILEIANPTDFPLDLKWYRWGFQLLAKEADRFNGANPTPRMWGKFGYVEVVSIEDAEGVWQTLQLFDDTIRSDRIDAGAALRLRLQATDDMIRLFERTKRPAVVDAMVLIQPTPLDEAAQSLLSGAAWYGVPFIDGQFTLDREPAASLAGDETAPEEASP